MDEPVSLRPAPEEPIEDTRPALRVETVDADETGEEVTPRPAPERPRPESRVETPVDRTPAPQPEPARAEPEAETPAMPAQTGGPARGVDTSGEWVVQIASFRSESDAEAAWLAFRSRFADIASGLVPDVASVEIANRGTYHRLRIAAFTTREDAVAFCASLQGRGQDCLVARR